MSQGFWKRFLIDAGIPVKAAESYTSSFVDNRITESMVPDLSKNILFDLGITIIGDVIAILKHAIHVTQETTDEKKTLKKQSKLEKSDRSSERTKRDSKKRETERKVPEKKIHEKKIPEKKVSEKLPQPIKSVPSSKPKLVPAITPKTVKTPPVSTLNKSQEKNAKSDKPPRKVRITDQIATKKKSPEPSPTPQEIKRKKIKKDVSSVRRVSAPSQPVRTVSTATITDNPVRKITTQVKSGAPVVKHHVTHSGLTKQLAKHVVAREPHVVAREPHVVAREPRVVAREPHVVAREPHVVAREPQVVAREPHVIARERQKVTPQKVHFVKRTHETLQLEESDLSSEEETPVTRRVFGATPRDLITSRDVTTSRDLITSRDVTTSRDLITSRDVREEEEVYSRSSLSDSEAVFIKQPPPISYTPVQTTEPVQVITRILPNQPRTITRSVPDTMPTSRSAPHASVTRMVQNVRCVSPDSTTDIPPSKLKQTTTIILNTKGKCSVRPVSPPADLQLERKRKVLPRDGKTALTRVVQRHLGNSPRNSPKRTRLSSPKTVDTSEPGKSEKYNSFRSDAEEREERAKNKFRSEDDHFDIVTDQRVQIRRKVRSRSFSGGRSSSAISRRLGSSRRSDLRKSFPARAGRGVAARILGETRAPRVTDRLATRNFTTSLRSRSKEQERSVFTRLGD